MLGFCYLLGMHIAQLWKFFWMADEEVSKNVSMA